MSIKNMTIWGAYIFGLTTGICFSLLMEDLRNSNAFSFIDALLIFFICRYAYGLYELFKINRK